MHNDLQANKQSAIDFYRTACPGDPENAVELFVGAEYIQHNPLVANGKQSFIAYFRRMAKEHPGKTIEFVRAVAEDDPVALNTHQVWSGDEEYMTIDLFRFAKSGKVVELRDSIQQVPDTTKNGNTMY